MGTERVSVYERGVKEREKREHKVRGNGSKIKWKYSGTLTSIVILSDCNNKNWNKVQRMNERMKWNNRQNVKKEWDLKSKQFNHSRSALPFCVPMKFFYVLTTQQSLSHLSRCKKVIFIYINLAHTGK